MLGESDRSTGQQIRHALPEQAGAVHEVVVDKDGNVGFDGWQKGTMSKWDAETESVKEYRVPKARSAPALAKELLARSRHLARAT